MRKILAAVCAAILVTAFSADARPGFGQLFYDGDVVRTVVPPAAMPQEGRDPLFAVMEGAEGQLAVIAVAPGDRDYHGGQWAFYSVTWNTTPYLLTSDEAVRAAESAGDVSVTRVPENDFKCPVQP